MTEQTFGQKLVRVSFNPSSDSDVDMTKAAFAELIDMLVSQIEELPDNEEAVCCLQMTIFSLETSAMYAVKGLTASKE